MTEKKTLLVLGCGFLTSHLIPQITPFVDHFILIDREKIEKVNYDNYLLPKGYESRRKVTAFTVMINMISYSAVSPIHENVRNIAQLERINAEFKPDIAIVGFDNVRGRIIARDFAVQSKIPTLSTSVTENYVHVNWIDRIPFPSSEAEILAVEEAMSKIRDVCTRIEFRMLGTLAASLAYSAFTKYVETGEKVAYTATTHDILRVATIRDIRRKK